MRAVLLVGVLLAGQVAFKALAAEGGFPPATASISTCENRWALLADRNPARRVVGFIYVDPTMGFTLNHFGMAESGPSGEMTLVPDEIRGKAWVIMRIPRDVPVACLDEKAIATLQLPSRADAIENYRDKRPAGQHLEMWASWYNHIGAVKRGLEFTDEALARGHSSAKLSFERGFAFNALERFPEALKVLEPAVKSSPADIELIAELAYAYMGLGDLKRSIATYEQAIDADEKKVSDRRWEFAQNIAASYNKLGDKKQTEQWLKRAEQWKAELEKRREASGATPASSK